MQNPQFHYLNFYLFIIAGQAVNVYSLTCNSTMNVNRER
jgi:hypothetical protein